MAKYQAEQQHFPCQSCGSDLTYEPGTRTLTCEHCGHENAIELSNANIQEYSFQQALQLMNQAKLKPLENTQVVKCPNCAATFELEVDNHAGDCPFCGTPVVTGTEQARLFQPKSLLPFTITEKQARNAFDQWITGLWFAPSALKNKAKRDEKLLGIYVPYWTYDSHTDTAYRGQQGRIYYERQLVTVMVNGQARQQMRSVPKIRWTPASGQVRLFFDDILVGATKTLPRKILDRLEPWDLHNLVAYDEAFLSGFQSELYQLDLDEGFKQAQHIMNYRIREAVKRDIGGDQQRITQLETQYSSTTFKHLLLPVWSAAFRYNGQVYRFVINGRNGKTQGERPYSKIKITLAVLVSLLVIGASLYFLEETGILAQLLQDNVSGSYYNGY